MVLFKSIFSVGSFIFNLCRLQLCDGDQPAETTGKLSKDSTNILTNREYSRFDPPAVSPELSLTANVVMVTYVSSPFLMSHVYVPSWDEDTCCSVRSPDWDTFFTCCFQLSDTRSSAPPVRFTMISAWLNLQVRSVTAVFDWGQNIVVSRADSLKRPQMKTDKSGK